MIEEVAYSKQIPTVKYNELRSPLGSSSSLAPISRVWQRMKAPNFSVGKENRNNAAELRGRRSRMVSPLNPHRSAGTVIARSVSCPVHSTPWRLQGGSLPGALRDISRCEGMQTRCVVSIDVGECAETMNPRSASAPLVLARPGPGLRQVMPLAVGSVGRAMGKEQGASGKGLLMGN